jgi:hypothetical protein
MTFFIWTLLALGVSALFSVILGAGTVGTSGTADRRAGQTRCPVHEALFAELCPPATVRLRGR